MDTTAIVGLAHHACTIAGKPAHTIEPIRIRDYWMFRIPAAAVIRVRPPGRMDIAVHELRAADWFAPTGCPQPNP